MACYICQTQHNYHVEDAGTCFECSRHVCGPPPVRLDGAFHGDRCRCGCGKFVCQLDMPSHSAGHENLTVDCFPRPTLDATLRALDSAVRLDDPRTPRAAFEALYDAINRFLNVVIPGTETLWTIVHEMPDNLVRTETIGEARWLAFQSDFLRGDAPRRCAALTARTLAETMLRHDVGAIVAALSDERREAVSLLLRRHVGNQPPPRMVTKAIDELWLVDRFEMELPDAQLLEDLPVWDGALDGEAMAQWLVESAAASSYQR